MIVQACLNGNRDPAYHPALPLTPEALAGDAAACVAQGAAELHVHPRGIDGRESLNAVDDAIAALRRACPGTLVGVSTGAWIEESEARTRQAVAAWRVLPDYASVNLSEPDAPALIRLLRERGVGVEAGLASPADAERLVGLADAAPPFRVLIEIGEQDADAAREAFAATVAVLDRAGHTRPRLLHGLDETVWAFVRAASKRRWSTRVGLEDGRHLPDGRLASDNPALVAAALALFREQPPHEA